MARRNPMAVVALAAAAVRSGRGTPAAKVVLKKAVKTAEQLKEFARKADRASRVIYAVGPVYDPAAEVIRTSHDLRAAVRAAPPGTFVNNSSVLSAISGVESAADQAQAAVDGLERAAQQQGE